MAQDKTYIIKGKISVLENYVGAYIIRNIHIFSIGNIQYDRPIILLISVINII